MEALQRLHNRGSVSTGYDIEYSVKNEDANGERFQSGSWFTNYSSTKTFTYSMWVKRTDLTTGTNYLLQYQYNTGVGFSFGFAADNSTQALYYLLQTSGTVYAYGKTTALYRDTSAWYHIVWRVDTTQATAADRIRIYVNGVQQDLESGGNGHPAYPSQNYDAPLQTTQYVLGAGGTGGFCGYCSEYYFIDGQSLAPTEFGEFDSDTGIWKPIEYTGTFGNEGYYLDFADASALGKDVSPNNQGNFSHYGGSSTDQATDTPTNNFCTLNTNSALGVVNYIEGATIGITASSPLDEPGEASIMFNKGKWYYECRAVGTTDADAMFGLGKVNEWGLSSSNPGNDAYSFAYHSAGRVYYNNNTSITGWATYGTTDKIMVAIDHDNGFAYFGVNGTWGNSGVPTSGATGTGGFDYFGNTSIASGDDVVFAFRIHYRANNQSYYNFGGYTVMSISSAETDANGYGTFEYAPPSGYYALCTKNLAEFG